jgi:hypothetical protein
MEMKKAILSILLGILMSVVGIYADAAEQNQLRGVLTLPDGKDIEFSNISGVRHQNKEMTVYSTNITMPNTFQVTSFERIPGEIVLKPVDDSKDEILIRLNAAIHQISLKRAEKGPDYHAFMLVIFDDGREENIGPVFIKFHSVDIQVSDVVTIRYSLEKLVGGKITFKK